MPTNLSEFFNYLATPAGGALVVLFLIKQVDALAVLEPGLKRLVGILLCLVVSALATTGLYFLKIITVIDANVLFQVMMEAYVIASGLQLITAPPSVPVLPTSEPTLSVRSASETKIVKAVLSKNTGFGWW